MIKLLKSIFFIIAFFSCINYLHAEQFKEGEFLQGEYINKKDGNKTYYMTVQFIKDEYGNIVYCLEPFKKFKNNMVYSRHEDNFENYLNLDETKINRIKLLAYYGYGYRNRLENKWYAITQLLIWQTIKNDSSIYFTDTLNGKKIIKYSEEISELIYDVESYIKEPFFIHQYKSTYKKDLIIPDYDYNYEIISSPFQYEINNVLIIKSIYSEGSIFFRRRSDYTSNISIFINNDSQSLIKPGTIDNRIYEMQIIPLKGRLTLDIRKDNEVYSAESEFKDVCYEIESNNGYNEKVCTDEELTYKTQYLPYGEYIVKQISTGLGYKKDLNEYKVIIDNNNQEPTIILNNYLLENKIIIQKKACQDLQCELESDAIFYLYDIYDNEVTELITNEEGYVEYKIGYGHYYIQQIQGKEGYSLVDNQTIFIENEDEDYFLELYNNYLEKPKSLVQTLEYSTEVELPPKTKIDMKKINIWNIIILLLTVLIIKILFTPLR